MRPEAEPESIRKLRGLLEAATDLESWESARRACRQVMSLAALEKTDLAAVADRVKKRLGISDEVIIVREGSRQDLPSISTGTLPTTSPSEPGPGEPHSKE